MIERTSFILEHCRGKKVLNVGCTNSPMMMRRIINNTQLHLNLQEVTDNLYGLDLSEKDVEYLRQEHHVRNLYIGDCERIDTYFPDDKFEVVVAGELIEHLSNPGLFLTSTKSILAEEGILIITVPNGPAFRRGLSSLLRRETVNAGHNFYFSKMTITRFLLRLGYEVEEIYGYRVSDKKHRLSYALDKFAGLFSEFACDGIALTAKMYSGPIINPQ
ncbi:class I SAM-dependent methyltransferase [Acidobacteriota bacterium]